jgi:hypothetical protein
VSGRAVINPYLRRPVLAAGAAVIILLAAGFLLGRATAQSGSHGDGHAEHHDLYKSWRMPGTNVSCCNESDCRPTRATQDMDGNWRALVDGRWIDVPASRVLDLPSPDGRSHICAAEGAEVPYCFVPGPTMGERGRLGNGLKFGAFIGQELCPKCGRIGPLAIVANPPKPVIAGNQRLGRVEAERVRIIQLDRIAALVKLRHGAAVVHSDANYRWLDAAGQGNLLVQLPIRPLRLSQCFRQFV